MATLGSQIGQFIERKRAENALHHAQMELAHVTRVATLGEMTASIAHEINQPLGAIVNSASAGLRWLEAQKSEGSAAFFLRLIGEVIAPGKSSPGFALWRRRPRRRRTGSTSTRPYVKLSSLRAAKCNETV